MKRVPHSWREGNQSRFVVDVELTARYDTLVRLLKSKFEDEPERETESVDTRFLTSNDPPVERIEEQEVRKGNEESPVTEIGPLSTSWGKVILTA
jgi:hypothetical protein